MITESELIRSGVTMPDVAVRILEDLNTMGLQEEPALLKALASASDPDSALACLQSLLRSPVHRDIIARAYAVPALEQSHQQGEWDLSSPLSRLITLAGASERISRLLLSQPDLLAAVVLPDDYGTYAWTEEERRKSFQQAISHAINQAQSRDSGHIADHHSPDYHSCQQTDTSIRQEEKRNGAAKINALRHEYWRQIIALAAADCSQDDPIHIQPRVSAAISDVVDCALESALDLAADMVPGSEDLSFAVIGMGKLGAQEINYVSDVDLIYLVEPRSESLSQAQLVARGTAWGTWLQKICQSVIPSVTQPPLWKVDCALRPEGKDGPLVRTLASHLDYYRRWAQNWEFQALLKARFVAGDRDLGQRYIEETRPLVWTASARENFVFDCRRMRERVENLIPDDQKDLEIKLGRGGLRDVEFTVQMLQLVHGRTDESLRASSTLDALTRLARGGYVSRKQAQALSWDYRFERVLEHRQQLWTMRRTHLFPSLGQGKRGGLEKPRNLKQQEIRDNPALTRLARALKMPNRDLIDTFDSTRRQIRRLHMDIYYRPMLGDISHLSDDAIRLSPQALLDRFTSIGFADPQAATRHVQFLTRGVSRAAKINRILLPAVLLWLGDGQNPDMGLLAWRRLVENHGNGGPYLGFLRDSPVAARRLSHILSNSRFLGDALNRSVESITWLGSDSDLYPHTRQQLDTRCRSALSRFPDDLKSFSTLIRAMRRREIERIGLGWMSSVITSGQSLSAMTDVYDAAIDASLSWAIRHQLSLLGCDPSHPPAILTVIAMGRYGGREVNFSSDADIMIIYDQNSGFPSDQAAAFAQAVVTDLRAVLTGGQTTEAKIDLDFDLRPEGKNGPLIRSFESYQDYYSHWSQTWEHQALLRARYAAGDRMLAETFLRQVADPLRYRSGGLTHEEVTEIRTLKARMEAERLPRGIKRDRHLKLGAGGLSDVEWTVQLLQLSCGAVCPPGQEEDATSVRTTSTLQALKALEENGTVNPADAEVLRSTWQLCTQARNAHYLWTGRAKQADIIPDDSFSLGGMAACLGWQAHQGQEFANKLIHDMRRCRKVAERLFYGR